jgi:hypothetical protein
MTARLNRRWFQFSLKTLLVVTTVAGFGLGYIAYERRLAHRQREIKADLAKQKINVLGFTSPRPDWLKGILGDDTAGRARSVVIRDGLAPRSPAALAQVASNLQELPSAVSLIVEDPRFDDESLGHFREVTHLQYVWLNKTQVTDDGVQHLRKLKSLKQLNIMATRLSNAGLAELARHQDLETLGLGGTSVTDAGLHELKSLKKLQFLSLMNTRIGDDGLKELQSFPALVEIDLRSTLVTEAGVQALQAALPNLKVVHESLPKNQASPIYGE